MASEQNTRPNIILIMADDLGFSDIGCYGSEIRTPNLDRLGENGIRFTQMYNGARCCPARASLLTGLHPHQAGIGQMCMDLGEPGYQGYLRQDTATLAEVLKTVGYRTLMSGKWHVGGIYEALKPETWKRDAGDERHPIPTQRGFDRYYGTLNGCGSFFDPVTLMEQDQFIRADSSDYYTTDAFTDKAIEMVEESVGMNQPFFLYLPYTAPHWPLHAWEEDVARYEGYYKKGWDAIRTARHEELKGKDILDKKWDISPRDVDAPPWEDQRHKDWEDIKMAVYAAQIDRMDQGIGKLMDTVRALGQEDNTLVLFLSDNGGCAEFLQEEPGKPDPSIWGSETRDGRPITVGNVTGVRPGGEDTFMTYDLPWTNVSNAPFRLFKHWVHEGGISTPCIAYWPEKIKKPFINHDAAQLVDITATVIEVAGAKPLKERDGHQVMQPEGESFAPIFDGKPWKKEKPMFWEHEGNRAVRMGDWKLVAEHGKDWELYNMVEDRTELRDLADKNRDMAETLKTSYEQWARRCGVLSWPPKDAEVVLKMRGEHIHLSYHRGRKYYA